MSAQRCTIAMVILLLSTLVNAAPSAWQHISPGLDYRLLQPTTIHPWAKVHLFRLDLSHYRLDLALASDYQHRALTAQQFARNTRSLITINGGFFTPLFQPLGLRVQRGQVKHAFKSISWWGVFYIRKQHAAIIHARDYSAQLNADFAIQAGPRLIADGKVLALKPGRAERSALAITTKGRVIIAVTENTPLTTTEFATLLAEKTQCVHALNLDGGSSSQLFAVLPAFNLSVTGFTPVSDAIVVRKSTHL